MQVQIRYIIITKLHFEPTSHRHITDDAATKSRLLKIPPACCCYYAPVVPNTQPYATGYGNARWGRNTIIDATHELVPLKKASPNACQTYV